MKLLALASSLLFLSFASFVRADLASESFDYGGTPTFLGPAQNGGTGFNGGWQWGSGGSGGLFYSPNGLSFGSFTAAGGSVYPTTELSSVRSFNTPFSAGNPIGFGAYLFKLTSYGQFQQVSFGLSLENAQTGQPQALRFDNVAGPDALRSSVASFDTFNNQVVTSNIAAALSLNTTYMQLFSFNLSSNTNTAQSWIVSSDQYEILAQDGITIDELNARNIGQGNNSVLQKLSLAGDFTDQFVQLRIGASRDNIMISDGYMFFDEIRLSSQSFNQALGITTVPEPSAAIYFSMIMLGAGWLTYRRLDRRIATS
jgi:hypothetical protein